MLRIHPRGLLLVVSAMLTSTWSCTHTPPRVDAQRAVASKDPTLRAEKQDSGPAKSGGTAEAFAEWEFGGCEPFLPSDLERRIEQLESRAGREKIDPEQPDQKSFTLFHKAIFAGRLDLAKRLIALGADPNGTDTFGWTALDMLREG